MIKLIEKIKKKIKPHIFRPINKWTDLTKPEQQDLLQDFLNIPIIDFCEIKVPSGNTVTYMLSLRELTETLFVNGNKIKIDESGDVIREGEVTVQDMIQATHQSIIATGVASQLFSAKMQRIVMHHVYRAEPESLEWDMTRMKAEKEYEDFMETNKDKFDGNEKEENFYQFMFAHSNV